MTHTEMREILLKSGYPNQDTILDSTIDQINKFQEKPAELFNLWLKTNVVADDAFNIDGITPQFLRQKMKLTDVAVIIYYNWLLVAPNDAKYRIWQKTGC
jgi:hypothetical protein